MPRRIFAPQFGLILQVIVHEEVVAHEKHQRCLFSASFIGALQSSVAGCLQPFHPGKPRLLPQLLATLQGDISCNRTEFLRIVSLPNEFST